MQLWPSKKRIFQNMRNLHFHCKYQRFSYIFHSFFRSSENSKFEENHVFYNENATLHEHPKSSILSNFGVAPTWIQKVQMNSPSKIGPQPADGLQTAPKWVPKSFQNCLYSKQFSSFFFVFLFY